jgi:hypothetical protein
MADNVAITAGSGTTVATDERTIGGTAAHVQRVDEQGSQTIAVGVASVTTTSGSAVAARDTRKRVVLLALPANTANIDVGASGVASGSGFPLAPGASVTLYTTAAIHADAASGTQSLAYVEEFD